MANAKSTVIKGVGYLYVTDVDGDPEQLRLAYLQNCEITLNVTTDDWFGGDGLFPIASYVTEKTGSVKATSATFDVNVVKVLLGGTKTLADTGVEFHIFDEGLTIEAGTTYTLVNGATLKSSSDAIRFADTGTALTRAGGTPASTGQYAITAGGVITFADADAGKEVLIDYIYTATADTVSIGVEDIPGSFKLIHVAKLKTDDTTRTLQTTIYKVRPAGSLTINFARDSATAPELNFSILNPNRADGKIVDFALA